MDAAISVSPADLQSAFQVHMPPAAQGLELPAIIVGVNSHHDAPLWVAKAYQLGVIVLLSIGLISCIRAVLMLQRNFNRLAPIIKYHTVVILHDISMCLNFITRDIYHLWFDLPLQTGDWCQWSAYIAMISVTSTYISAAWVAYATFNLTERRPLTSKGIALAYATSLAVSCVMASLISGPTLGPYKGLYCAMEMTGHGVNNTLPFIVVYTICLGMMGLWYVRALDVFRDNTSGSSVNVGINEFITRASSMLLSDGITLMVVSQATWAFLLLNGMLTAFGFKVHYMVDIAAAWVAKLQPSVDSIVLMHMMHHGVTFVKHAEDRVRQERDEGVGGTGATNAIPTLDLQAMDKSIIHMKSEALLRSNLVRTFLERLNSHGGIARVMGGTQAQRKGRGSGKTLEALNPLAHPPRGREGKAPVDLTGMITHVLDKAVNGKSYALGSQLDELLSLKHRNPSTQASTGQSGGLRQTQMIY